MLLTLNMKSKVIFNKTTDISNRKLKKEISMQYLSAYSNLDKLNKINQFVTDGITTYNPNNLLVSVFLCINCGIFGLNETISTVS